MPHIKTGTVREDGKIFHTRNYKWHTKEEFILEAERLRKSNTKHNPKNNPRSNAISSIAYAKAGGSKQFYLLSKKEKLQLRAEAANEIDRKEAAKKPTVPVIDYLAYGTLISIRNKKVREEIESNAKERAGREMPELCKGGTIYLSWSPGLDLMFGQPVFKLGRKRPEDRDGAWNTVFPANMPMRPILQVDVKDVVEAEKVLLSFYHSRLVPGKREIISGDKKEAQQQVLKLFGKKGG